MKAYYGDYAKTHPSFVRPAWGFTFEAGTQAMRLVLSGLFDTHPGVKLILGHLGETIPYVLPRIDEVTVTRHSDEEFSRSFYVTFLRDHERLLLRSGACDAALRRWVSIA